MLADPQIAEERLLKDSDSMWYAALAKSLAQNSATQSLPHPHDLSSVVSGSRSLKVGRATCPQPPSSRLLFSCQLQSFSAQAGMSDAPASCFFRMISAAASLLRCCSVPLAVFLFFYSIVSGQSRRLTASSSSAYHASLSLQVLFTGLVSLVASRHVGVVVFADGVEVFRHHRHVS